MLFVVLLWYYLGTLVDSWRTTRKSSGSFSTSWWNRVVGAVWITYGYFICSFGRELIGFNRTARWIIIAVFVWGVAGVAGGLYLVLRRQASAG